MTLTFNVDTSLKFIENFGVALGKSLIEECCEFGETFQCIRGELYNRYKEFCEETGFKDLSQIKFNKELECNFNIPRRKSGSRLWSGLKLKYDNSILE